MKHLLAVVRLLEQIKYTKDMREELRCLMEMHKIFEEHGNSINIDRLINQDLILCMTHLLKTRDAIPLIQYHSGWVLTFTASKRPDHIITMMTLGAAAKFIELLRTGTPELKKQSLWALAILSYNSARNRDFLLSSNIVESLVYILRDCDIENDLLMARYAAVTISNLTRGKQPYADMEKLRPILPYLHRLLKNKDMESAIDATWAIVYISGKYSYLLLEAGMAKTLVELLQMKSVYTLIGNLMAIKSTVGACQNHFERLAECGLLKALAKHVASHKKSVEREAVKVVAAYMVHANKKYIQQTIDLGMMSTAIKIMFKSGCMLARYEAIVACRAVTLNGSLDQVVYLVEKCNVIKGLVGLIHRTPDVQMYELLECIDNIIRIGQHRNNSTLAISPPIRILGRDPEELRAESERMALEIARKAEGYDRAERSLESDSGTQSSSSSPASAKVRQQLARQPEEKQQQEPKVEQGETSSAEMMRQLSLEEQPSSSPDDGGRTSFSPDSEDKAGPLVEDEFLAQRRRRRELLYYGKIGYSVPKYKSWLEQFKELELAEKIRRLKPKLLTKKTLILIDEIMTTFFAEYIVWWPELDKPF